MNMLLVVWLLASTTALASPHLNARGEKYCPDTTGEVMCPPSNSCGVGPNLGLCCPFEGGALHNVAPKPAYNLPEVPPSTTRSGSTPVLPLPLRPRRRLRIHPTPTQLRSQVLYTPVPLTTKVKLAPSLMRLPGSSYSDGLRSNLVSSRTRTPVYSSLEVVEIDAPTS